MKRIVLSLIFLVLILKSDDLVDISLRDYASIVASANKMNIIVPQSLKDKKITLYLYSNNITAYTHYKAFLQILHDNDLDLVYKKLYYVIEPKKHYKPKSRICVKDIDSFNSDFYKKYLSLSDFNFTIANNKLFIKYPGSCKTLDKKLASIYSTSSNKWLSLTLVYTNIDKLKKLGSDNLQASFDFSQMLNLSSSNNGVKTFVTSNVLQIKSMLNYLQSKGVSKVVQKPKVLIMSNKDVRFKVVKSIPFLLSKKVVTNNQTQDVEQYEYRDVGLNIYIKPIIYNDYTYIDMDLILENIINLSERPITSKVQLKDSYKIKDNQALVLSGLVFNEHKQNSVSIPLLSSIPLIGKIFKGNVNTSNNYLLTIIVTVYNNYKLTYKDIL